MSPTYEQNCSLLSSPARKTHKFSLAPISGIDILRKKPKNAPGDINSALAKFPEYPKLSDSTP